MDKQRVDDNSQRFRNSDATNRSCLRKNPGEDWIYRRSESQGLHNTLLQERKDFEVLLGESGGVWESGVDFFDDFSENVFVLAHVSEEPRHRNRGGL